MRALVPSVFTLLFVVPFTVVADPPEVSYVKDVKPFLTKYCFECHSARLTRGGLNLDTFALMMKGGQSFTPVKPGKPEDSVLVTMTEGRFSPIMPPKNAKAKPTKDEVAMLRAWVAAGAKDDSQKPAAPLPEKKLPIAVPAPVSAAAFRPDGQLLVAGGRKEVFLINPVKGEVVGKLGEQAAKVTAIAFSGDGKRLAVASSTPGAAGEVRLYAAGADDLPDPKPTHLLAAHTDQIHGLAFSPDGKLLATCGYDRLIKLWDATSGQEVRTLTDHSDAVYAVAFSSDGKLLASGSADRAVKIWETATGKRLLTLGDSTDWVYTLTWSPNGKHLAAAGVDKSIRVWDVTPTEAKLVHAVFAHEGPVIGLAYAADGQILYSLSEDKSAKAWTSAKMTERIVYPKQPDAPLTFAVRPDHKQLALGRFDGALVLLNEADGKTMFQPLPLKPQINKLSPISTPRGQTVRVTIEGKNLEDVTEATADVAGVTVKLVAEGRTATTVKADVTVTVTVAAGPVKLTVKSPTGTSGALPLIVDLFPETKVIEPNNSPSTGQPIGLPASVGGNLANAGDVDCFRFEAKAGQELGVQVVTAAVGSKLEPVLQLTDLTGRVLAETSNGLLGHKCDKEGSYALTIRDKDYRGGADFTYRLHAGGVPVVTSVFPLGVPRGRESPVVVSGVHLGNQTTAKVTVATDAAFGSKVPVPVTMPNGIALGNPTVVVGEFPEVLSSTQSMLTVPGTGNGRVESSGTNPLWKFPAKKGQRLIVEVQARRLGSPLDSVIEILDAKGQPLPRATLRATAKTYTVFRDHDSASTGIRIEAWNELAMNDYLFVGTELIRIKALPLNPDADCNFFSVSGQRVGYLDTTPTHHSLGTPMYKVAIHPPGATFPPNGLPVFTLNTTNDDGGPGYGKDSRIFFDPPTDGEYQVKVTDARGLAGVDYAYRLTVRPPRPGFQINFDPKTPAVWRGGALPINVTAERIDGYEGPIALKLHNLTAGYSAPDTTIPAGETSTTFALFADANAHVEPKGEPLKLVARATIDGQEVVREVVGGLPKVVDFGDIVTTVAQSEVVVKPGQQVTVTAKIDRLNGFKGRVPVDVKGLPHGVRVLDIGLNGVLITERESSRSFVIYCEPWVEPQEHPIVVLARLEGKNTEHAAKSVLLKVVAR